MTQMKPPPENPGRFNTFLMIDTLKKCVNLMDKRHSSEFTNAVREFVSAGGTVLGMAHTNKRRTEDGKAVFAGTTDIRDDFDAAYILDQVGLVDGTGERLVEFTREKSRGGGVASVAYSYAAEDGISYAERLASVRLADPDEIDGFRLVQEQASDAEVIAALAKDIGNGTNTKIKLRDAVSDRLGVSRRQVAKVLERYTGDDPAQHHWFITRGPRGAMIYTLVKPAREPDQADSTA